MKTYSPEHWKALGAWVASARTQAGFSDTKQWAGAAERSTRQLLGLERGESVGPKTIESVAAALGVDGGELFAILETGKVTKSWGDLKAAALEKADRLALAQPPASDWWTNPAGDEADEPVTWSHMEGRLSEIEARISRLERTVLRVVDSQPKGGDGHDADQLADRRAASMKDDADIDEAIAALEDQDNPPGAPEE